VNVVVYVSDALRIDHLGCYGAKFVNTRTIDGFADTGLRFDQAITAAAWTAPAMTSIATGLYPQRHGVFDWANRLDPAIETVFESFARAGHVVGSFVFDDEYLFSGVPSAGVQGRSEDFDGVLGWLDAHAQAPFMLFVHSWATHMPYNVSHRRRKTWQSAKAEYIERLRSNTADGLEECREAYRRSVEYQSETLFASLLERLDQLGLADTTTVVFAADHGESWGERFADKSQITGMYHLHGAALYDEILRVPLIVRSPGLGPGVVTSQVRTVDITPTLRDLAGLPPRPADGASLLPLARGQEHGDRSAIAVTSDRGNISWAAARQPPWKLMHHVVDGRTEAYRIDVDPRETIDRTSECPPQIRALLDEALRDVERRAISEEEEAAIEQRLGDLGYL
jgi:arylsulfatase A-like enzyme